MKNIRNVIFDLGGVILNIDMKLTENALRDLGAGPIWHHGVNKNIPSFFKQYEAGKIDDKTFIGSIQSLATKKVTDEEVIAAWNALLLDFPRERIELLKRLRENYRLFLLSNTNAIHHRQFQKQLLEQTGSNLDDFFEKAYYSHVIGLCKPDIAAYRYVIDQNGLNPSETIFIDDTPKNIEGAEEAGLHSFLISADHTILDMEWR